MTDLRMSHPEVCCDNGYCFEGLGIHEVGYGEARRIELAIFAAREQAWDEGYRQACGDHRGFASCATGDHGQHEINPYRRTQETR